MEHKIYLSNAFNLNMLNLNSDIPAKLSVSLAERQVLSKEEVLDLYDRGQASFVMVEVV